MSIKISKQMDRQNRRRQRQEGKGRTNKLTVRKGKLTGKMYTDGQI